MKAIYQLIGIPFIALLASNTSAQPDVKSVPRIDVLKYEAPCYDTTKLFEILKDIYKEFPIVAGKANDAAKTVMSLWYHPTELTWTLISTKSSTSCVIGLGTDFKLIPYGKGKGA